MESNNLQFLNCSRCQGSGFEEGKKACSLCNSYGMGAWTGDKFLYWGKKIDPLHIVQDKVHKITQNIINTILFLISIAGLLSLGHLTLSLTNTGVPFWKFWQFNNWQMFVFWFSLINTSYLFYRFQRIQEKIKKIPKRKYEEKSSQLTSQIDWPEISSLKKNQKVDISLYYTPEAVDSIKTAWEMTNKCKQPEVKPIHLLISLLTFQKINDVFGRLGISFEVLKTKLSKTLAKHAPWDDADNSKISSEVFEIIFSAYVSAWQLRQQKVELTEILESLALQQNEVKEVLYDLDIDADKIKNVIAWLRIKKQLRENWKRFQGRASLRPKGTMNRAMTAVETPTLDAFSTDLTILARAGYLMPCIGREKEIEDIFRIMQGGTRKSSILIGNPGTGKTTVLEGIAQKMVENDIPKFLQDKRLVSLSVAKLVSGASAAEAQQRVMIILNEMRRSGNVILYIADIHNMIGITAGTEGSMDLSGVLAQSLSGNILLISSTTPNDYRHYIEGRSSLDNVLEKVPINEVSTNEAIQILEAKSGSIEYKNQIFFSYDAIAQIVELSNRYIQDRYLPEKAIEVMQEVATRIRDKKGKDSIVSANDVAQIISEKTSIPLTDITQEESQKLLNLEEKIHERIIGQEEAVKIVSASLRRARAEIRDTSRPIVNLLFLGPTGVGKTELAKTVALIYFGNENNMIRLDMSEYQEKSSINRLIGAPPGHAGSREGGHLAEAIRKKPFSLILLDEIEKAHPDILNIFLQVMDDGRLTDGTGRTVDFTNSIIIGTSNAGTSYLQNKIKEGLELESIKQEMIDTVLNEYYRPEFLNRFDGIVLFKPLKIEEVAEIAKLMLKDIKAVMEERGVTLRVTHAALSELAQAGFNPTFGARPLRRVIQDKVQDKLANYILAGKLKRRDVIIVDANDKIIIEQAEEI